MSDVERSNLLINFSREECENILRKAVSNEDVSLLEYSIQQELNTVGFLGEYYHLFMKYKLCKGGEKSTRFFVKTMPHSNVELTKFMDESSMLHKEASLYNLLLGKLSKYSEHVWCARCFFIKDDLFVLENISDWGYQPLENTSGFFNKWQIMCLLNTLAIMHASSIAYEVKEKKNIGDDLKEFLTEKTVSPSVGWFTAGLKAVIAVALEHPSYQSSHEFIKTNLPPVLDTVYDLVNPSKKYRNVFCHRDPWGGNVFFKRSGESYVKDAPVVLVDFQLCRYSPMALDVMMALNINIKPKDLNTDMDEYLNYYYDCFASSLKKENVDPDDHITKRTFMDSYKELELFGVLITCMSATILRLPDGYLTELKLNNPEECYRYTNIDRTDAVLQLVRTNEEFGSYMFDCVEKLLRVALDLK